jgi:hypothetical protein
LFFTVLRVIILKKLGNLFGKKLSAYPLISY